MVDLLDLLYEPTEAVEDMRSRCNVARAIMDHRIQRQWTQAELARQAGTKQSRVSEIENAIGNVRFDTLDKVSRALGLTVTLEKR